MCLKCVLVLLAYHVLLVGLVALKWGALGALNFGASFWGFFLILLAGYQKLKGVLQNTQADKTPSKFAHFALGVQSSISWLKLGAYALLLVCLFVLMDFKIFMPLPYLLGLGACLIGVLALRALNKLSKR
ncbi:hypothetical protein [Helicobacter bizzozeronii]|uniref:hypothetical protein n=1 Tax=Helicobacter bizzozeronii TaxID=56877 RepID=UPI000CEDBC30|nr:hypothetical protein [Helicobacter bizzozeronii]